MLYEGITTGALGKSFLVGNGENGLFAPKAGYRCDHRVLTVLGDEPVDVLERRIPAREQRFDLFLAEQRIEWLDLAGHRCAYGLLVARPHLGHNLAQERLTVAVGSVAQARSAIAAAIDYTQNRKAFGTPVASFQNTKFELASCSTRITSYNVCYTKVLRLDVAGGARAAR